MHFIVKGILGKQAVAKRTHHIENFVALFVKDSKLFFSLFDTHATILPDLVLLDDFDLSEPSQAKFVRR